MKQPPPSEPGYGQLRQELDDILTDLESGELDLDTTVASYERGLAIIGQLETQLKTAENRVSEIRSQYQSADTE